MDWTAPVDLYCERVGAGLRAEPLNAVSNLAFFLAALYGLRLATAGGRRDRGLLVLAGLAATIGAGSLLFHTVATPAAMLADVIPIAVFIIAAFGLVMTRLAGLPVRRAVAATAAFLVAMALLPDLVRPAMGSSSGYAPTLAALALIGGGLTAARRAGGRFVLAAAAVFAVSLSLRMADGPLCAALPMGTHFGWHLLNAVVLALVMRAVRAG